MSDPLAGLLAEPATTCIATDFDGTIAPIVDDPDAARPLPGAAGVLLDLTRSFGRVGVISGRPAAFLVDGLDLAGGVPGNLAVVGLYGLERLHPDGRVRPSPDAEPWRDAVTRAAEEADATVPAGARVERKGLAVTLHWRTAPDARPWAEGFARDAAARHGLSVHPGKMNVELRPPLEVDKGTALSDMLAGFSRAAFAGDDRGDLPAFAALDRLRASGGTAVKVAVAGPESPGELLAAADVTVDGPEGALALLADLARRAH